MNFFNEKEKKLQDALNKLNTLEFQDNKKVEILEDQKNQLQIEKDDIEKKILDIRGGV